MRQVLAIVLGLVVGGSAAAAGPADRSIDELVARLGDPRYDVRLDAQQRLLDHGLDAFDPLLAATRSPDPEVAATGARLLEQLRGDWLDGSRPADGEPPLVDSPEVRRVLAGYADLTADERSATIGELARLLDVELSSGRDPRAAAALARIARFEPASHVAREAALVLLASEDRVLEAKLAGAVGDAIDRLSRAHGRGRRETAQWLATAAAEVRGEAAATRWRELAEAEGNRRRPVAGESSEGREGVAATLHWRALRAALAEQREGDTLAATTALATLNPDTAAGRLGRALLWMADAGATEAIDATLATHRAKLGAKRGGYIEARLLVGRGEVERSERAADAALAVEPDAVDAALAVGSGEFGPRVVLADELEGAGFVPWARREWLAEVEGADPLTIASVYARQRLSDSYADEEQWTDAAAILAPLAELIEPKEGRRRYNQLLGRVRTLMRPEVAVLRPAVAVIAKRWAYEALAMAARGAPPAEQEAALRKAIEADDEDADILISMHRLEGASEEFAADTRRRVRDLAQKFDEEIATEPGRPAAYNQWAWLVANTEGDYQKAIRYSRRSLDLDPGNGGYLDTLGRCLYAAGDYRGAVDRQRKAIAEHPHMKVMQRQLALFQRALAEDEAMRAADPGAE
ncbi:MAG: hypothetical protein ACRCT8_04260 [Lacipirellulaceae bacterium]